MDETSGTLTEWRRPSPKTIRWTCFLRWGEDNITQLTIKFASHFRARVGQDVAEITFEGTTLRQLIPALVEQFEIADLLLEEGEIRSNVRVVIDGRYSYLLGGLDALIPEGATVALLYTYGGRFASH